jgi:hypothetical protein
LSALLHRVPPETCQYAAAVTAEAPSLERAWLVRALLVLQAPRPVFVALRDDSDEAASARVEPVLALVWLAGIAGVLSTPVAGRLLDDPALDGLLVAVWAFVAGGLYGFFGYWLGGVALFVGLRSAGSPGSFRRARHLLAFALAPLALSLVVVWPIRVAAFGGDLFRSGGSDEGAGDAVFVALGFAFAAWSLGLLVIGARALHGWSWPRAVEGTSISVALVALVVLGARLV